MLATYKCNLLNVRQDMHLFYWVAVLTHCNAIIFSCLQLGPGSCVAKFCSFLHAICQQKMLLFCIFGDCQSCAVLTAYLRLVYSIKSLTQLYSYICPPPDKIGSDTASLVRDSMSTICLFRQLTRYNCIILLWQLSSSSCWRTTS